MRGPRRWRAPGPSATLAAMARRSPRSRRKSKPASKLPQSPRVRSTPGKSRAASPRAGHVAQGARRPAAARKTAARKKVALAAHAVKRRRFLTPDPVRVDAILEQLHELYPDARCALDFASPLQLLIATILSAQCTDERVNMVTPALFAAYPGGGGFGARRARGAREGDPLDGLLPQQGEVDPRGVRRHRAEARRRGTANARGAHRAPGRGAEDRERRARKRLRHSRRRGGHPRHAAREPARAHERDRSGEDRVRAHAARAARAVDAVLALADPARSRRVPGPEAPVQRLPARAALSEARRE